MEHQQRSPRALPDFPLDSAFRTQPMLCLVERVPVHYVSSIALSGAFCFDLPQLPAPLPGPPPAGGQWAGRRRAWMSLMSKPNNIIEKETEHFGCPLPGAIRKRGAGGTRLPFFFFRSFAHLIDLPMSSCDFGCLYEPTADSRGRASHKLMQNSFYKKWEIHFIFLPRIPKVKNLSTLVFMVFLRLF